MNDDSRRRVTTIFFIALIAFALIVPDDALARKRKPAPRYGEQYCAMELYGCTTIQYKIVEKTIKRRRRKPRVVQKKVSPKWEEVWPDEREREIVKRLNRMNGRLKGGMVIAYPLDMEGKTYLDYSPFPARREGDGEKLIVVDLGLLAFAAYDEDGILQRWGPIAGGRSGLRTPKGEYEIIRKRGGGYRSGKYPKGCGEEGGGACSPMPYAMFFKRGYAMHGGYLPGRHASHGCVRMYWQDAKWLNREFAPMHTRIVINWYPEGKPWHFTPPTLPAPPKPEPEPAAEPEAAAPDSGSLDSSRGGFLHGLICEILAALKLGACDHEGEAVEASLRPLLHSLLGPVGEVQADNPGTSSLARQIRHGLCRLFSGGASGSPAGGVTP